MEKVFIVAEAGVNYNGDINLARKLVDVAVEAGADAIKFQTFRAEQLVTRQAVKAKYQIENTGNDDSQFNMLKVLELSLPMHQELITYCQGKSIMFLSAPFSIEMINLLSELGLNIFKIPSGEITNLPYLRKVGSLKKKVILSTGMANLEEVKAALKVLTEAGTSKENITVLHCHTDYPTAMEDVNLKAMLTLQKELGVEIGYSDHTLGIEVSIAAVALGASTIEKHFTLDKTMPGPDHKASLDPPELKAMVLAIRNIEKALGSEIKQPTTKEIEISAIVRKSIVAKMDIKKGEIFTEENLTVKRPGTGLSPMEWDRITGQEAKRDFKADELIIL
ncbi:MAG: N-acetylneuraminate synthase [bacterium]|nr:N-acetylneuraminate synthase [bacterium]